MSCGCNRSYQCCSQSVAPIALSDITRSDADVGDAAVWDGSNWVPGTPNLAGAVKAFDTLEDMLAEASDTIVFARVKNYEGSDGIKQLWLKVDDADLSDNGTDIRVSDDGAKYMRIFSRG